MARGPVNRSLEDVEKALTVLVLCNGNSARAAGMLRRDGTPFAKPTLDRLREKHAARYQQRRQEMAPQLEEQLADDLLETAAEASRAARLAVADTIKRIETDGLEDPARAARELSQVATQAVDKRLAIQGRPTQITEVRDVADIIRSLQGKGIVEVIDATAIEEEST